VLRAHSFKRIPLLKFLDPTLSHTVHFHTLSNKAVVEARVVNNNQLTTNNNNKQQQQQTTTTNNNKQQQSCSGGLGWG